MQCECVTQREKCGSRGSERTRSRQTWPWADMNARCHRLVSVSVMLIAECGSSGPQQASRAAEMNGWTVGPSRIPIHVILPIGRTAVVQNVVTMHQVDASS